SGDTYQANALIKARIWAQRSGLISLADDSGLEVDALDGRPGVYSNRYAPTSADRIVKLLGEMQNVEEARRTARFVCVMALVWPDGKTEVRRGVCEGRISFEPAGVGGFGYDPVFYLPDYGQTMAELPADEKNKISHRARAAQPIREILAKVAKS
ncbi:MAG: RdgB/HAM1 family non-canonical purine NTP pyrophosphatase, partial [Candidatus Sumerlaeota bacterium]|nr:RdgB/HAM1 family non-canonical purine NTP pyrophosphatase [Candidatus Sumerlaeota bacterium]